MDRGSHTDEWSINLFVCFDCYESLKRERVIPQSHQQLIKTYNKKFMVAITVAHVASCLLLKGGKYVGWWEG